MTTDLNEVLNTSMQPNDAGAETVKEYLLALLDVLWERGENMVKRPFGNSGWQYEIYDSLVHAGLIDGTVVTDEEYVYVKDADIHAADELISKAIWNMNAVETTDKNNND